MVLLDVRTNKRVEFIDITDQIQKIVSREKIEDGICYIFVPHTTAGITINENADPAVIYDITTAVNKLVDGMPFTHSEGNSPGHIKSSLFGCSTNILIEQGKLILGTWQGIYFCEFDGPRNRRAFIKLQKS